MGHAGMRYSLASRELIADGVEAVCRGHAYDALVAFAGCDKTLPGMMMAMVAAQPAVGVRLWRRRHCPAAGAGATSPCSIPTKASAR